VLDAAASGPLSNEDIRALTGLDTAGARAVAKHLVARGELVTTGQKRGTRYQLAER
jgi:Fic family protein